LAFRSQGISSIVHNRFCLPNFVVCPAPQSKRYARKSHPPIRRQIPDERAKIEISLHLFPEPAGREPCDSSDITLYPGLRRRAESRKAVQSVKRIVDIVGRLLALPLPLPVKLVIALAVKLTSCPTSSMC
jgi:hypothetical protein